MGGSRSWQMSRWTWLGLCLWVNVAYICR